MARFHTCAYIHNMLADVLNQTLIWIKDELLDRARFAIISTYDKAVERIRQLQEEDPNVPPLPAITLDPGQPTIPDGTVLWRFSQLSNLPTVLRSHEPIIETDNWKIYPIFQPVVIECETIFFLPSVYEYLDVSLRVYDFFGGVNRWVRPRIMQSHIIVPTTLQSQEYDGSVIDLSTVTSPQLIKSLGRDEICFEALLTPRYQLTGVSDASTKYGGDTLADWRASFSMRMEVFLPTWFIFEADWKVQNISVMGRVVNSLYPSDVSEDGRILDRPLPVEHIMLPCLDNKIADFYDRYFYTVDRDYDDPDNDPLTLQLPIDLTDDLYLLVWSYGGEMDANVHYTLDTTTSPNTITFKVPFKEGDIIEFWYYKTE